MGRDASYVRFDNAKPGEALAPALAAHLRADEDARPIEAVKRQDLPRAIDYGSEPERAQAAVSRALAERKAAKTGGRPPSQSVSALFAAPPPWESREAWPLEKVNRWARATCAWLRKLLPQEAVTHTATLHTDERAPHLHITFVPVAVDGKGVYSLSWRRVLTHMAEKAADGRRVLASPKVKMQALQDSYYRDVGQHFGMERGKRGRGIQYAPLDRAKGAAERIADTSARLEDERRARADAERQRAEAETARQRTEAQLVAERERAAQAGRRKDEAYADAIELADMAEATAKTATARLEEERTARTEAEQQRADADAARKRTEADLASAAERIEETAARLEEERRARTTAERGEAEAETARERTETQLERERRRTERAEQCEELNYQDAAASLRSKDQAEAELEATRQRADAQSAAERKRTAEAERRAASAVQRADAAERRAGDAAPQPRGNPHRGAATTARADRRTRRAAARSAAPAPAARETARPAPEAPRKQRAASRPTPATGPRKDDRW